MYPLEISTNALIQKRLPDMNDFFLLLNGEDGIFFQTDPSSAFWLHFPLPNWNLFTILSFLELISSAVFPPHSEQTI